MREFRGIDTIDQLAPAGTNVLPPVRPMLSDVDSADSLEPMSPRSKPLPSPTSRPTLASGTAATREAEDVPQTGVPGRRRRDPMAEWRVAVGRTVMVVVAFSVFVNVLMLTLPIYLFQISDRVLTSKSMDTLLMLSILAIGLIGILSVLDILRRIVVGRLSMQTEAILGGAVLGSIVNSAPTGVGGDTQPLRSLHQLRTFISSPTMLLLFDAPLAPIYFAVIFLINPVLGWLVLAAGVALSVIAIVNQTLTVKPLSKASSHSVMADSHGDAIARNAQVINAMGMFNESLKHWGSEQARAMRHQLEGQERNVFISGSSKFIRLIAQIAILGTGAYLALNGQLTGGMMIAASIIAGRALQPLEGMIEGWRQVMQARQAYANVRQAVATVQSHTDRLILPRPEGHVSADRLLFLPLGSKEPILNGISFSIEPGELVAVVGHSGSGKSTLAKMLVGCLYPTAGKVRLDETELRNWDREQFGRSVGYLPQEVELFPGTIKDNVCRMRTDLADEDVVAAARIAGVHEMISHLPSGYETQLDRNGSPLSGGQKQRIALARAFFGRPSLVVLDEPNSNLDASGEQALAATLKRAKSEKVTVVVITQRPALLNIVDKVLVLRSGRAEAYGEPNDVLRRLVGDRDGAGDTRSNRGAAASDGGTNGRAAIA
ncbi:MAG: type I secretion system permease/ATPase [Hyphomicrobiaceae bacterium]